MNVALGVAGLRPLLDYRGCADPYGRRLAVDRGRAGRRMAGAAEIVTRKTAGTPVAIVRGAAEWMRGRHRPACWCATRSRDLFR